MREPRPSVIGTTGTGGPMAVDVDRLVGSHACIVANSGGGKSGLVRRLLETTHGRVQHIVLDGEDEFYTLRERFPYVIAGGEGGDAPATPANAASLAIGALTHGFSLIAQLNDLGADGAPDFIGRFLLALVNAPRELWHPVLVVVDEAQRFVPRRGDTAATEGVLELLSRGRKRGFTLVAAGTKLSEIDPRVRGGCNNWLLGRVGQALDRRTMAEQLGFTGKEARELRSIEDRQFYAFGPALSREPVLFRVADVETTPVRAGQAKVPTPPAPQALRKILQGLAPPPATPGASSAESPPIPAEAEAALSRASDQLRAAAARIGELEERERLLLGQLALTEARLQVRAEGHAKIRRILDEIEGDGDLELPAGGEREQGSSPLPLHHAGKGEARARAKAPVAPPPSSAGEAGGDPLTGAQLELLRTIAWWEAMGQPEPTKTQVAAKAGWKPKGSHLRNRLAELSGRGLVHYPRPGRVALTGAGATRAPEPDLGETLLASIGKTLSGAQAAVLDVLLRDRGEWSRARLAAELSWDAGGSHLRNRLSELSALELVEYPNRGHVRVQDWVR